MVHVISNGLEKWQMAVSGMYVVYIQDDGCYKAVGRVQDGTEVYKCPSRDDAIYNLIEHAKVFNGTIIDANCIMFYVRRNDRWMTEHDAAVFDRIVSSGGTTALVPSQPKPSTNKILIF